MRTDPRIAVRGMVGPAVDSAEEGFRGFPLIFVGASVLFLSSPLVPEVGAVVFAASPFGASPTLVPFVVLMVVTNALVLLLAGVVTRERSAGG